MAEPDELEEDLFADLYDGDDTTPAVPAVSTSASASAAAKPLSDARTNLGYGEEPDATIPPNSFEDEPQTSHHNSYNEPQGQKETGNQYEPEHTTDYDDEPLQMKDDGKMFIGGLNWETTDESLYEYFSQFGEVAECTVMRDGASGRSRGFGFLTFKDPRVVETVMSKEHFLDGKIIDPKRAIPRDEQERTSKIFVGGVSQDATEADFTRFFEQFGRVIDATLMMDKDTGRPRGFGFVTFDSEAAVDRCLHHVPLEILNKPIEVKKAQPRGKMGEDEHGSHHGRGGKFGHNNNNNNNFNQQNQVQQTMMPGAGNMTPQMMAQYWQKMQQYFAMMQQMQMAGGMGMNPQMMAQMQQMQMQNSGMNPQMMQQMMGMQNQGMNGNQRGGGGGGGGGFTSVEQQAFEQRKYEQQSQRRPGGNRGGFQQNNNQQQNSTAGPQSWEGMYDGEPQPDTGSQSGSGRGSVGPGASRNNGVKGPKAQTPQPSSAPAGAPTGPKNAGRPGSNFRGGRGGRYHPYGR